MFVCVCVCGCTAEASERKHQCVHKSWRRGPRGTSCQEPHSVGVLWYIAHLNWIIYFVYPPLQNIQRVFYIKGEFWIYWPLEGRKSNKLGEGSTNLWPVWWWSEQAGCSCESAPWAPAGGRSYRSSCRRGELSSAAAASPAGTARLTSLEDKHTNGGNV